MRHPVLAIALLALATDAAAQAPAPRPWWRPAAEWLGLENRPPARQATDIFDPQGQTSGLLAELRIATRPWNGLQGPQLLIIGRDALSGAEPLPGDIEKFVAVGGKLLLMPHDPIWLREFAAIETAPSPPGRLLPGNATATPFIPADLPLLAKWSSATTPDLPAPVRLPDPAHWRALLKSSDNPAFTPLMEADYGWGRITCCFLDLTPARSTPGARDLVIRLIRHAARPSSLPEPVWPDDPDMFLRLFHPRAMPPASPATPPVN